MMKKIWTVGISRDFEMGGMNPKPYKIYSKFEPYSCIPTKPLPDDYNPDFSLELLEFTPSGFLDCINGFSTSQTMFTDNIEKLRKAWLIGVYSSYKHVKKLEKSGLSRIDKRTERAIPRIMREIEEHREEYPEVWL